MTSAYDQIYLNNAMRNIASMMDHAVNDLMMDADEYFELFIRSGIAGEFGCGNPKYIAGRSGAELVYETFAEVSDRDLEGLPQPSQRSGRSKIYWCGWVLAYYQWFSGRSFDFIHKAISFAELASLYPSLHEADIIKAAEALDKWVVENENAPYLKMIRKSRGITQKKLADSSGIALRAIRTYEQHETDIGKAQGKTLHALTDSLGCNSEDLLRGQQ